MSITWTNERRKLRDLQPWERNPRTIKNRNAELLAQSVEDFGQVETLAIGPNGEIYNGHQRLSVLAGQHGLDYEVDVRVASRELQEKERERLTVYLHRGAAGEWDWEELEEWDFGDLTDWGLEEAAELEDAVSMTDISTADTRNTIGENKKKQIRPVISVENIGVIEAAIKKTGLRNRGDAVIEICKRYVEETRQFDFPF